MKKIDLKVITIVLGISSIVAIATSLVVISIRKKSLKKEQREEPSYSISIPNKELAKSESIYDIPLDSEEDKLGGNGDADRDSWGENFELSLTTKESTWKLHSLSFFKPNPTSFLTQIDLSFSDRFWGYSGELIIADQLGREILKRSIKVDNDYQSLTLKELNPDRLYTALLRFKDIELKPINFYTTPFILPQIKEVKYLSNSKLKILINDLRDLKVKQTNNHQFSNEKLYLILSSTTNPNQSEYSFKIEATLSNEAEIIIDTSSLPPTKYQLHLALINQLHRLDLAPLKPIFITPPSQPKPNFRILKKTTTSIYLQLTSPLSFFSNQEGEVRFIAVPSHGRGQAPKIFDPTESLHSPWFKIGKLAINFNLTPLAPGEDYFIGLEFKSTSASQKGLVSQRNPLIWLEQGRAVRLNPHLKTYLFKNSPTSITLSFPSRKTTSLPEFFFKTELESNFQRAQIKQRGDYAFITLNNLQPATVYNYFVKEGEGVEAEIILNSSFETLPLPRLNLEQSFVQERGFFVFFDLLEGYQGELLELLVKVAGYKQKFTSKVGNDGVISFDVANLEGGREYQLELVDASGKQIISGKLTTKKPWLVNLSLSSNKVNFYLKPPTPVTSNLKLILEVSKLVKNRPQTEANHKPKTENNLIRKQLSFNLGEQGYKGVRIDELEADSDYAFVLLRSDDLSSLEVARGEFKTLPSHPLYLNKADVDSSSLATLTFNSAHFDDQDLFLIPKPLPSQFRENSPYHNIKQNPLTDKDLGRIAPSKITRESNNSYLYSFEIPHNYLQEGIDYKLSLVAKQRFEDDFSGESFVNEIAEAILNKNEISQPSKRKQSSESVEQDREIRLVQPLLLTPYRLAAFIDITLPKKLLLSEGGQDEEKYYLIYNLKDGQEYTRENLGGDSILRLLRDDRSLWDSLISGSIELNPRLFSPTSTSLDKIVGQTDEEDSQEEAQRYHFTSYLSPLLNGATYNFRLIKVENSGQNQLLLDQDLRLESANPIPLPQIQQSLTSRGLSLKINGLSDLINYKNAYISFKLREPGQSKTSFRETTALFHPHHDALKKLYNPYRFVALQREVNPLNSVTITPQGQIDYQISLEELELILARKIRPEDQIDWIIVIPNQIKPELNRLTDSRELEFNKWYPILGSSEAPLSLETELSVRTLSTSPESISLIFQIPAKLQNQELELSYLRLVERGINGVVVNSDDPLRINLLRSAPEGWQSLPLEITNHSNFLKQISNLKPNSDYLFRLTSKQNPDKLLWESAVTKTLTPLLEVKANAVKIDVANLYRQIPLTSDSSANFILNPALTNQERNFLIDFSQNQLIINNLLNNHSYSFLIKDSEGKVIKEEQTFLTEEGVDITLVSRGPDFLRLRFANIEKLKLTLLNSQLSSYLGLSGDNSRVIALPFFLALRERGESSWRLRELKISSSLEEIVIDKLQPGKDYQLKLIGFSPLNPNPDLVAKLIFERVWQNGDGVEDIFQAIILKFLASFKASQVAGKLKLESDWDRAGFLSWLAQLLARLALDNKTLASLQTELEILLKATLLIQLRAFNNANLTPIQLLEILANNLSHYLESKLTLGQFELLKTINLKAEPDSLSQALKNFLERQDQDGEEIFQILSKERVSNLSNNYNFKTTVQELTTFTTDNQILLLINQSTLQEIISLPEDSRLRFVVTNLLTKQRQERQANLLDIGEFRVYKQSLTRINQLKEQLAKNSKNSEEIVKEIASLEQQLPQTITLPLLENNFDFNLDEEGSYRLNLYIETKLGERLFLEDIFKTKESLTITPQKSLIADTIHLLVRSSKGYRGKKIRLFFKLKEGFKREDSLLSLFSSFAAKTEGSLGIRAPKDWQTQTDLILIDQWYYQDFEIETESDLTNIYLDIGIDSIPINYVAISYDPKLGIDNKSLKELSKLVTRSGLVYSGASNQERAISQHQFSFEGELGGREWVSIATLKELGLLAASGGLALSWETSLIEAIKLLKVKLGADLESSWYPLVKRELVADKDWFIQKTPDQSFLVYYLPLLISSNSLALAELHLRLKGELVQARIVASKLITNINSSEDIAKFDWNNSFGKNISYFEEAASTKKKAKKELPKLSFKGISFRVGRTETAEKSDLEKSIYRFNPILKQHSQSSKNKPLQLLKPRDFIDNLLNFELTLPSNVPLEEIWDRLRIGLAGRLVGEESLYFDSQDKLNFKTNPLTKLSLRGDRLISREIIVRDGAKLFGFLVSLHPIPIDANTIKVEIIISEGPYFRLLNPNESFENLTWERFLSGATQVGVANENQDSGVNITNLQFDLSDFRAKELVINNFKPTASFKFFPENPLPPLIQLRFDATKIEKEEILETRNSWYDPGFSTLKLDFFNLLPKTDYLLTYNLKGASKISDSELKQALEAKESNNNILNQLISFQSDAEGRASLTIKSLNLNSIYEYNLYKSEDIKNINLLTDLKPLLNNSLLSYTFYNDSLVKRGEKAWDRARLSGWVGKPGSPNFLTNIFNATLLPLFKLPYNLIKYLSSWFFNLTKKIERDDLKEASGLLDPIGDNFLPADYLLTTNYYSQAAINQLKRRSFYFNFEDVFGQNKLNNNSWQSRAGWDRQNRFADLLTSFSQLPKSQPNLVFGSEIDRVILLAKDFIDTNIKALRVGGSFFGFDSAAGGSSEELERDFWANNSTLLNFLGSGNYLATRLADDHQSLRLYYLVGNSERIASSESDPNQIIFKGLIISFTIFAGDRVRQDPELRNKIFASIVAAVKLKKTELENLFGDDLDISELVEKFADPQVKIIEEFQQLRNFDPKRYQTIFVNDILFNSF